MFSPHTCKWMCALQNAGLQNLLLHLHLQGCRAVLHCDSASQTFLLWKMKWASHNLLYFTKLASFTNIFRDVSTKLSILSIQLSCFCFFWKPLVYVTFFSHLLVKCTSLSTLVLTSLMPDVKTIQKQGKTTAIANATSQMSSGGPPFTKKISTTITASHTNCMVGMRPPIAIDWQWQGWRKSYWGFLHAKSKRKLKEVHPSKQ